MQSDPMGKTNLNATTDDQWDQMAAIVRQEIATGEKVFQSV